MSMNRRHRHTHTHTHALWILSLFVYGFASSQIILGALASSSLRLDSLHRMRYLARATSLYLLPHLSSRLSIRLSVRLSVRIHIYSTYDVIPFYCRRRRRRQQFLLVYRFRGSQYFNTHATID